MIAIDYVNSTITLSEYFLQFMLTIYHIFITEISFGFPPFVVTINIASILIGTAAGFFILMAIWRKIM